MVDCVSVWVSYSMHILYILVYHTYYYLYTLYVIICTIYSRRYYIYCMFSIYNAYCTYTLINLHPYMYPLIHSYTPIYSYIHIYIQLDKALSDYDECIRLDPTFAEAYNKRAEIKQIKGKSNVILYYIIAYIMIYVKLYALYSININ